MNNLEKFREVFGYDPDRMPCPKKCPDKWFNVPYCTDCPYDNLGDKEYKEEKDES